jgi:hypothetical protein
VNGRVPTKDVEGLVEAVNGSWLKRHSAPKIACARGSPKRKADTRWPVADQVGSWRRSKNDGAGMAPSAR